MEDRTAEQLAQDYSAMGDSVALINAIIAGDSMAEDDAADRQDCVDRNTQHLELMVAKDDWGDEDMTAVNAAISAGNGYTASQKEALVMIAELVAFNAAFGVVKQFIGNGKDLHDCFGQIGQMVNAKEDLKARQQKNKKSLFANDAEEFMALETIARAEQELQDFMVYYGRAGLWDDFIVFQAKARKARLEARNAHAKKINQRMHYAGLAVGCAFVCVGLYACFTIIFAIAKQV